jgi:hypothetical protein
MLTSVLLVGLWILVSQTPAFYALRRSELEEAQRAALSKQFLNKITRLISDIRNSRTWQAEFEEGQINGWLAQDFQSNHAEQSLPPGVSEPRVAMEGDLLRVGFRYQRGLVDTIVQIGLRAWTPSSTQLALELHGAKAGALPLPTHQTRRVIEQIAFANDLDVSWYRNGQYVVAVLTLPRGQRDIILQRFEIRSGGLLIKGLSGRRLFSDQEATPKAN